MEHKDSKQDIKINTLETNYKAMSDKLDDVKTTLKDGFKDLKNELKDFKDECNCNYVSKDVFSPIKTIVYGMVGFILLSFLAGLAYLVFK